VAEELFLYKDDDFIEFGSGLAKTDDNNIGRYFLRDIVEQLLVGDF